MKFNLRHALVRRFIEIFASCAVPSAIIAVLNKYEILDEQRYLSPALLACVVIFLLLNAIMQRHYYYDALGNKLYYYATLIPYGAFAFLNVAAYYLHYKTYVWFFTVTKFLSYSDFRISNRNSIVIFHMLGLIVMSMSFVGLDEDIKKIKADIKESMRLPKGIGRLNINPQKKSAEEGNNGEENNMSRSSVDNAGAPVKGGTVG